MVINRFLALREIFHRQYLQIKIQCASFRFVSFVWILVEHLCILYYYSSSLSVVMFVNADTGLYSVLLQQCLEILTFLHALCGSADGHIPMQLVKVPSNSPILNSIHCNKIPVVIVGKDN
jgi:hypothetical protein